MDDDALDLVLALALAGAVYYVFGARIGAMIRGTTQDTGDSLPVDPSAPSDVTVQFGSD